MSRCYDVWSKKIKWEKASLTGLTGSCRSGRDIQKKVRLAQKIQARYTIKDSNAGSGHHPFRSRPRALSTEAKYACNNRMCCRLKPDGSGEGIKPQERMQGGSSLGNEKWVTGFGFKDTQARRRRSKAILLALQSQSKWLTDSTSLPHRRHCGEWTFLAWCKRSLDQRALATKRW